MTTTEQHIEELRLSVSDLRQEISQTTEKISALSQEIIRYFVNRFMSQFPGVKKGDKVTAVLRDWAGKESTEVLYLGDVYVAPYTDVNTMDMTDLRVTFYQVKKDGTRSSRFYERRAPRIVSLTKVEE